MRSGPAPVAGAQIRFYLDNGHVRFAGPEICKFTLILYKTRSGLGTDSYHTSTSQSQGVATTDCTAILLYAIWT